MMARLRWFVVQHAPRTTGQPVGRMKTSALPLVSPATRWLSALVNATPKPSGLRAGQLADRAWPSLVLVSSLTVVPATRSGA